MQTIRIPWTTSLDSAPIIAGWQRIHASAVRSAHANAVGLSVADLKILLNERYPDYPLGSWGIHCAALEGVTLRKKDPLGAMVFGGKDQLLRRQKGLISHEEWQSRRHTRAIQIIGDRTRWGNRHFRLSKDGRTCQVTFLKQSVTLNLAEMSGKQGRLVRAIAKLSKACQISVQFSLGRSHLSITFDPMDLRKLPTGTTLEAIKIAEQGASRKGRRRKIGSTHYAAHRVKHIVDRPIHPEWRDPIATVANRVVGIDLNPEWIGITVVKIGDDPKDTTQARVLDHKLHRIAVPINAPSEQMTQIMAVVARDAVSMARAWGAGLIVHEDGLGKLAWSKKSGNTQTVNYWARNALINGLKRRCDLAGLKLNPIWAGYTTTIGNLIFDLPDACASAAEIARRGLAAARGIKDRLPAVPPMVHLRQWKDGEVPAVIAQALTNADSWPAVHRAIKSAQTGSKPRSSIGYRRLHPPASLMVPGRFDHEGRSYAVNRIGTGKGACCSARPIPKTETVRMVGPGASAA